MAIKITIVSLDLNTVDAPTIQVFNDTEISIGRSPECDVVLDRPEVSGLHATLRITAEEDDIPFLLTDLGSSNGTLLENEALESNEEYEVQDLQRIIIGTFLIKPEFVEGDEVLEEDPKGEDEYFEDERDVSNDGGETVSVDFSAEAAPSEVSEEVDLDYGPMEVHIDGSSISGFDFVATELFRVRGRVLDQDKALKGVTVDAGEMGTQTTDSKGNFCFNEVPEGTVYSISVSKEGYRFEPMELDGRVDTGDAEIEISGRRLFAISGVVEHRGEPLRGVKVDGGLLGVCTTDDSGVFRFEGVPDGEQYTLNISKEGYSFDQKAAA